MKKAKSLETKLRAAIRMVWSRSAERREVLKAAIHKDIEYGFSFNCPICGKVRPKEMGQVDHVVPVGPLDMARLTQWVNKMFYSEQRVICVPCHKIKTVEDRAEMRRQKRANGAS